MELVEVIYPALEAVEEKTEANGSIVTSQRVRSLDHARQDANGNLFWSQRSQLIYPEGVDASKMPTPRVRMPGIANPS
jgi:hypothetical protein